MRVFRRGNAPTLLAAVLAVDGFINLATGLAPIFESSLDFRIEGLMPITAAERTSSVLSVLLGMLLLYLGKGLFERQRTSWAWAIVVLLMLLANNVFRGTTPQTSAVTVAVLAGLLFFRKEFSVRNTNRVGYGQVVAWLSVVIALLYGICGSYLLRDEFSGIAKWSDAIYFTFVTYSTLGYGDILPQTANAKIFVVSMILIGLGSFAAAATVLLGPLIENQMKGVLNIMQRFKQATNHVIVCGFTNVTESVIDELQENDSPYLVIETSSDLASFLEAKGHDVIQGEPGRRATLEAANIQHAAALICAFDSDSENILTAVTARELRPKGDGFRIVVRVEDEENIRKAEEVGADAVISPSTLGGRMMAEKAISAT